MNKEKNILVTGATGFIGGYILRELMHRGYQNITALRRPSSRTEMIADLENKVNWKTGDLLEVDTIYEAVSEADVVIHSAALVSFAPADRDALYEINVQGTANIVNACIEADIDHLVHISSVGAITKKTNGHKIDEKTPWVDDKYTSHYGRSKYLGELEVWRGMAEGLSATILNPTIVLGAGPWHSSSCEIFMKIYDGFRFYTPGSTGFIDVRDVAGFAVKMTEEPRPGHRYILSEGDYTFREIFSEIADGLDKKPPSVNAPRWVARSLILVDKMKTGVTGQRPIVTPDTVRNAYENFSYDTGKARQLGYEFIPVARTIRETTNLLKEAAQENFTPKFLPPASLLSEIKNDENSF